LASDLDRLIRPEVVAKQGAGEGIGTYGDEGKNMTLRSFTIYAVLSHIVREKKCKNPRWTKHVARVLTNSR